MLELKMKGQKRKVDTGKKARPLFRSVTFALQY